MTYQELVAAVRRQGGLEPDAADEALAATLEILGERLSGGAAEVMAAQLPAPAAAALRRRRTEEAHAWSLTDLAARVAAVIGVDAAQGANAVQAALRAVAESVDQERLDRVRDQLPSDVARLLQRQGEGDTGAVQTGA